MPEYLGLIWYSIICSFNLQLTLITSNSKRPEGPVVQSLVSLTSSLVVKMLTGLVGTISNSQVFLLKKKWVAFANAKATHIFSKNISVYAIFNDQSFNDTLTNDIISFEQLGPEFLVYDNSSLRYKELKCKEYFSN